MKTTLLILLVLFVATPTYAQGGLLNRAKDALNKKIEKKKEEPPPASTTPTPNSANESKPAAPTTAPTSNPTAPASATVPPPVVSEIGTIYFSNQPFTNGTEGSKTSFASNEFIYARLVLKQGTLREVLKPTPPTEKISGHHFPFDVYAMVPDSRFGTELVRSSLSVFDKVVLSEADLDKNTWDFDVFPAPDKVSTLLYWGGNTNNGYRLVEDIYRFTTDNGRKTPEGTYTLGIELKSAGVDFRGDALPEDKQVRISNQFSFTFRGADFAAIKANSAKVEAALERLTYRNQQLPPEANLPSHPLLRGLTEAQLRTQYLNHFIAKDRPDLQIIKFHAREAASSAMWSVQNNDVGIPRYRYSNQWFFMFVKNTRENACFFQGFGLRQNYSGGGTFGETFIDTNESIKWFPCEKMPGASAPAAAKPAPTKPATAKKP